MFNFIVFNLKIIQAYSNIFLIKIGPNDMCLYEGK